MKAGTKRRDEGERSNGRSRMFLVEKMDLIKVDGKRGEKPSNHFTALTLTKSSTNAQLFIRDQSISPDTLGANQVNQFRDNQINQLN